MAQIVKLRRSSVSGQKPTNSNLQLGELALNTTDGKVFFAKSGSNGPTVEELISTNTVNTGSVSISGSMDLIGNQIITGSIITTGSNKLIGNTQLTGSLTVSGSTIQIGNNTLFGTTLLSGSITISGSKSVGIPTVKIYGDVEQDGYTRYLPVNTNLNTTISGSYIFVSGSTDDLYFAQNGKGYNNVTRLRWLEGNLYTGLLNGGNITATVGGTTFNVSAGSGIVVNLNASLTDNPYPTVKYVNWESFTGQTLTYRTTNIQTFIGIDDSGQIVQQTGAFNDGQYNNIITLGTVIHQNLSTVNASINYPNVAYGYKQRTYDFIKAFGPLKLSGLNIVPVDTLGLNVGSGTAWADGRNYQVDPSNPSYITDSGTAVSKIFRYYQVSGTTFVQDTNNASGYTTLDVTHYNDNGTLTAVPGNNVNNYEWTIQRIFWYPNSATKGIVAYYGNRTYTSSTEAAANVQFEPFVEVENTKQNAVYLGAIAVRKDADFTNPSTFLVLPGGVFRNVGGSGGGGIVPTNRLADLVDVYVANAVNGDLISYNGNSLKWEHGKSLTGEYTITGSLNVTQGLTGSIDYSNLTNVPTLVSGSEQIVADFTFTTDTITNTDVNIVATSGDIILNADGNVYKGSASAGNGLVTDGYLDLIIGDTTMINTGTGHSIADNLGYITSSFNTFTSSYNTGSFTGSFIGDGSGLYNVPASGITGLNLSQIADGSATASISNTDGFRVNTNSEITGSMFISGPLNIGDIPVYGDPLNPEVVHIHNSGSYNGIVALGNSDTFYQTYIANTNSGNGASTDLIIGADNVTDNSYYVDLGINSSTYNAGYVGHENDSYLYAASDDLYIGTIGLLGNSSNIYLFTSNSWQNPQITVSGSGQIGFNSPTISDGYQYEFSGSIKTLHELSVGGSVSASYFTGAHIGDGSGLYNIPASGVTGLELNKIVDGSVSASISNGALRVNSDVFIGGVLTARELHTELVTSSVLYESGSTKFGNSLDDTHTFSGSILVHTLLETNRISPVSGVDVTIESSNLKVPNGGIYTDFNIESKGTISATSISGNTITGSLISGSFIGDATNLINVPFHISGSNISGTTVDKTFTKLQFDDSTGLNVDETDPGTAFISIGSHFKDIFVSGSPVLSATGSDAFEIIGLGGIHISSSTVDTNGNGYVKELTFDLTEISSSLDYRINSISVGGGSGLSDGGYATLNQTSAAATWSFNHNLGQRYPIVQVYDSNGKVMIPSEVIMVDSSTTTITFPSAQTGKAVASLGTGPGGMTQFFTSATTWSLQHDMGADYPIVTIYDVNKNIIMPDRVTSIDSNNIEVGFTTPVAGHLNVAKGGHIISGSINFSNISTAGSGIVSSSIQVYNYGYATTGSNAFNGSQLIKNAKIDARCVTVSTGTSQIFTMTGYDGANIDYVVKSGGNMRAGVISAVWDNYNSSFTETSTADLGNTSNVTFTVSNAGVLNAVVTSGTWTIEAMYRALGCS